jgi:hypothetical protein
MPDFPGDNDYPTAFEVGAKNSPVNESEPTDGSEAASGADRPADAKPGAVSADSKPPSEPSGETVGKLAFGDIEPAYAEKIYLAGQKVREWDARVRVAQATLKDYKDSRDEAVAGLMSLVDHMRADAEPNLFSASNQDDQGGGRECDWSLETPGAEIVIQPADPDRRCPHADESWREVPLADLIDLGAPKKIVDALATVGVNTMGEFNKWSEPNDQQYQKTVTNQGFKGVGPAALEKFEQALEKFWESRASV